MSGRMDTSPQCDGAHRKRSRSAAGSNQGCEVGIKRHRADNAVEGNEQTLGQAPAPYRPDPEKILGENLRAIREGRQKAIDGYRAAQTAWKEWHGAYDKVLRHHKLRQGPDVKGWKHDCSRSGFEAQYLREGARLARRYGKREDHLYLVFNLAGRAGVEPLQWQDWGFPKDDPHYYTSAEETAMAAAAPFKRIYKWGEGLPDEAEGMAGSSAARNSASFGGDHGAEYPEDFGVGVERGEPEMWESLGMVAEHVRQRRLRERRLMGAPERVGSDDGRDGGRGAQFQHPGDVNDEGLLEQYP
ncbi:hypothetical protein LTR36_006312 [Oleoguttula mirabilis]|uniref:Uncharacterized protein n=1 Tax=Oleoguttula mirabilis TaxID=1507867 RepID=A0AAV9JUB1_9PEZI|nr:hypothetical protein LTR36_006312 [Oleoguttula mirabilis]